MNSRVILMRPQDKLHSAEPKEDRPAPSPHAEGGEGWREEGPSSDGWLRRQQWVAPLPIHFPARSSRAEEVRSIAYFVVSTISHPAKSETNSPPQEIQQKPKGPGRLGVALILAAVRTVFLGGWFCCA